MPFKKITRGKDKGKFRSPSGRIFTAAQVQLYHATGGFKRGTKKQKPTKRKVKKAY